MSKFLAKTWFFWFAAAFYAIALWCQANPVLLLMTVPAFLFVVVSEYLENNQERFK